jgi:hypothetical protein
VVRRPRGQFGTAAAYYNNYRWQRQPQESRSLGRTFGLARDNRIKLDVRAEFFNVFNRLFLASPAGVGGTSSCAAAACSQPAGPNPALRRCGTRRERCCPATAS